MITPGNVEYTESLAGRRYVGDCFEVIPQLTCRYDLLLTDPPYAMPASFYNGWRTDRFSRRWSDTTIMHRWFTTFLGVVRPVLNDTASLLVFCDTISSAVFTGALYEHYPTIEHIIWDKLSIRLGRPIRRQHALILFAGSAKSYRRDESISSIFKHDIVSSVKRRHPSEKPTGLLSSLIDALCPPDGRILDPFAGSGSTQEAAYAMGRICDTIEISEKDEQGRVSLFDTNGHVAEKML